jgi:hypothetical protein
MRHQSNIVLVSHGHGFLLVFYASGSRTGSGSFFSVWYVSKPATGASPWPSRKGHSGVEQMASAGSAATSPVSETSIELARRLFEASGLPLARTATRKECGAFPRTHAEPRAGAVTNPVDWTARPACLDSWQEFRDIVAFIGWQVSRYESAALPTTMSTPA